MNSISCCCCARLLSHIPPLYSSQDLKSEKPHPTPSVRALPCCGRTICGNCIHSNERFATYCPFCQISTGATTLPQGLKDPPSYEDDTSEESKAKKPKKLDDGLPTYEQQAEEGLPSYDSLSTTPQAYSYSDSKSSQSQHDDILHFLDHSRDSMQSLSLRYGIPIDVLRKKNGVTADHLLIARRTVVVPGEWCKGGVSLSPRPVEGEEEETRRANIRRFMVGCKVAEYDVAVLYLEQANYDLELAMGVYKDDERWEKEHPIEGNGKGKGNTKFDLGRRRFTGQRS